MLRFFRFRAPNAFSDPPLSQILARELRRADVSEAAALTLGADAQVLQFESVRSIDGKPCLLESKQRCGVLVHQAADHLSFAQLTAAQARRLRLQAGHPCVVVRRSARDRSGRCVEPRTTCGDASAFEYTTQVR